MFFRYHLFKNLLNTVWLLQIKLETCFNIIVNQTKMFLVFWYLNTHTHNLLQTDGWTDRQTDRHTYIYKYTREPSALNKLYMCSCTPEHNSWELFQMKKYWAVGGGVLWRQSTIFLWGVVGLFFVFFNPVGGWLLRKCVITFCRWWSFSKMQFCGYPLFKPPPHKNLLEWKKKGWINKISVLARSSVLANTLYYIPVKHG